MKKTQQAVICDLDETLYPGTSIKDVSQWLFRHGQLSQRLFLKAVWSVVLHKLGLLNDDKAFRDGVRLLSGASQEELTIHIQAAVQAVIIPKVAPQTQALLTEWQKTKRLVLATESLNLIAEAVAGELGFDDVLATKVDTQDGRLTGNLASPVCVGEAKSQAVLSWAKEQSIDLKASLAVGSQVSDLPLLALCGQALVINPDPTTRRIALGANWQILSTKAI